MNSSTYRVRLRTQRLVIASSALLVLLAACSSDPGSDTAARDGCEAKWGVGNCVERNEKWVPLASATSTTSAPVTTQPSTTTASSTTAPTTTAPAEPELVGLDPRNMTYPAGSCGEGTPALPLSDGVAGPGALQEGPYNGVYLEDVLSQRDIDGDGTQDLEVMLSCDFGGNALAIIDYVVTLTEVDGGPVLISATVAG